MTLPTPAESTLWPTDRLVAVAALTVVVALVPALVGAGTWPVWFAALTLLVLFAFVDLFTVPVGSGVSARVELPDSAEVGDEMVLSLELEIAAGRAGATRARLEAGPGLEVATSVPVAIAGRAGRAELRLRPVRRGRAAVDALWIQVDGPLGLVRRVVRVPVDSRIAVRPSLRLVRGVALAGPSDRALEIGGRLERLEGSGTEFRSLREFVPGLDVRSIDWKSSARHQRLMCREYRAERNRQVVLAVDTGRVMGEEVDGVPRLDHAIQAALLLAWMGLRAGDRLGMFGFAARPGRFAAPRGGMAAFPDLVRVADTFRYGDEETNFTLGLLRLSERLRRRSLVIVLTEFVDSVTAELAVESLLRLARSHLVLFVALRDPTLDATIDADPEELVDLHEAVVADSLVRERDVVLRRLRRAGVHCVDAAPWNVGPEALNRYLEIKQRELL